jgi:hypothetical protein
VALGDPYADLDDLKASLSLTDSRNDAELTRALDAASRHVENWCHRQFNRADVAVPQLYRPSRSGRLAVSDIWTTDGLVVEVDTAGDGGFATTWASDDYVLEPLNGTVDGVSGWPYSEIYASTYSFPCSRQARVRVTAKYGWEAVPPPIKSATLALATDLFKLKDAAFGVTGGTGEFAAPMRVRENALVVALLEPYQLASATVLVA